MTPFQKQCKRWEDAIALAEAREMARENTDVRGCLIAYRNARAANDGEQLQWAQHIYYHRLTREQQKAVDRIIKSEFGSE